MPSKEQTSLVVLKGGLDTISDGVSLFETPGKAVKMINFEGGLKGGYRRISGYSKYSEATPDGVGTAPVVAARNYLGGCIAVQGGDIYYSADSVTWLQVNKDTGDAFVNEATLNGLSALTRSTSGIEHYRFVEYRNGTDVELYIVDTLSVNPLARFVISGTTYKYQEAGADTWGAGVVRNPTTVEIHNERLVVSGDTAFKGEVYYSGLLDPFSFISGGVINIVDEVVWCETFRENLIIFGKGSIKTVAGLGDPSLQNMETITSKIGCAAGGSVQEFAGGLIFLAPDGLRTVAATARIDDFELGTLTTDIQDEVLDIIERSTDSYISSTTVRARNQYRLFISDNVDALKGIGGVVRGISSDASGVLMEWNTFQGNSLYDVTSVRDIDNQEAIYQVNADPYVYLHDNGSTFDGTAITAIVKTPEMMFGDPGFRKSLNYVDVYMNIEGNADMSLQLKYDQFFDNTPAPDIYSASLSAGLALYDDAEYDSGFTYSAGSDIIERTPLQGSGKLVSFLFQSEGLSDPFTIQALNISYFMNGRF